MNLMIGNDIGINDKARLKTIFVDCYVRPPRPHEPPTRSEIKRNFEKLKPFSCTPPRLSYAEREKLQVILDEYLKKGFTRPSESEYVSPTVLVKKKTGEIRMRVDYRTLTKMTSKNSYPIPLIDDLLDRLTGKKYFAKLDLRNGFYHVFIEKDSVKYTSFVNSPVWSEKRSVGSSALC